MIEIYVDMREQASGILKILSEKEGYTIKVGSLPSGDYVIGSGVVIERKSASDFVASIMDQRLFQQVSKMKLEYANPIVLIEGDVFKTRSKISHESLIGAISWLNACEGITVLMLSDEKQSAAMIATMARHLQEGLGYEVPRQAAKPKASAKLSTFICESLPGVGPKTAQTLFKHFKSVRGVMNAGVEDLCQVPRIGRGTAERIYEAVIFMDSGID